MGIPDYLGLQYQFSIQIHSPPPRILELFWSIFLWGIFLWAGVAVFQTHCIKIAAPPSFVVSYVETFHAFCRPKKLIAKHSNC